MRTSVVRDDELDTGSRERGIDVSEVAREGLRQSVRRRHAGRDHAADLALPERGVVTGATPKPGAHRERRRDLRSDRRHSGRRSRLIGDGRWAVPAPEIIAEDDGWTVLLPGHPVAADGSTLDEALRDLVSALRNYAEAWNDRLHRAPNHHHAAALVQHVCVSDDDELLAWVSGPDGEPAPQQA